MKKYTAPPPMAIPPMAQPIPMPAFAPVERLELSLGFVVEVDEDVCDPTALPEEVKEELELVEGAVVDDGLVRELYVGSEAETVAPEEPSVRTSVFNGT